ncbi:MAG: PKD domain-containing protein, partial [Gammaproteobacteria bacterium]
AGADKTVPQGATVVLDGTQSSDSDGTIETWSWKQIGGPVIALENPSNPVSTFTAPRLRGQKSLILTFELSVTDDDGTTAVDRIQILVVK